MRAGQPPPPPPLDCESIWRRSAIAGRADVSLTVADAAFAHNVTTVWDYETEECTLVFQGHRAGGGVNFIAVHPDGDLIATCCVRACVWARPSDSATTGRAQAAGTRT